MNVKKYRKFVAAVAAVVGVVATSAADGEIDASEAGAIVVAVLGAAGVWAVPNDNPAPQGRVWK